MYRANASTVHQYWRAIAVAVASGRLPAAAAKVSTQWGQQVKGGESTYIILVYTTARLKSEVGRQFFQFFRRGTISYKLDAATADRKYDVGSTETTLTWPLLTPEQSRSQAAAAKPWHERSIIDQRDSHYHSLDHARHEVQWNIAGAA
jgi:hypothetical protein